MSAGELRSRVIFEQRQAASDGYGNTQGDFAAEFDRAATIRPRLGGEEVMAARLAGRVPVTIRVRQDSFTRQITTEWRARDSRNAARIFNLRSIVDPFEHAAQHGRYFDILAEEGVAT